MFNATQFTCFGFVNRKGEFDVNEQLPEVRVKKHSAGRVEQRNLRMGRIENKNEIENIKSLNYHE